MKCYEIENVATCFAVLQPSPSKCLCFRFMSCVGASSLKQQKDFGGHLWHIFAPLPFLSLSRILLVQIWVSYLVTSMSFCCILCYPGTFISIFGPSKSYWDVQGVQIAQNSHKMGYQHILTIPGWVSFFLIPWRLARHGGGGSGEDFPWPNGLHCP